MWFFINYMSVHSPKNIILMKMLGSKLINTSALPTHSLPMITGTLAVTSFVSTKWASC